MILKVFLSISFLHFSCTMRMADPSKPRTRTDSGKLEQVSHSRYDRCRPALSPSALLGIFQTNQAPIAFCDSAFCAILYLRCYYISLGLRELELAW